jgi:hypothetical protein
MTVSCAVLQYMKILDFCEAQRSSKKSLKEAINSVKNDDLFTKKLISAIITLNKLIFGKMFLENV